MFINVVGDSRAKVVSYSQSLLQSTANLAGRAIDLVNCEKQDSAGRAFAQARGRIDSVLIVQCIIHCETGTSANHQVRELENLLRRFPAGEAVKRVGAEHQREATITTV